MRSPENTLFWEGILLRNSEPPSLTGATQRLYSVNIGCLQKDIYVCWTNFVSLGISKFLADSRDQNRDNQLINNSQLDSEERQKWGLTLLDILSDVFATVY